MSDAPRFDGYPFTNHFHVLESGLRYHFLDEGTGEPIVMLHGNPSWSYYYRKLVAGLGGDFRTIVPDHIGCGLSDKPTDAEYRYTLESRVRDLESLLEALKPAERLTLVLHDWGGMIGMAWAVRHPERVARLVILNTAAFHLPQGKPIPWQLKLARMPFLGALVVRGFNAFSRGAVRRCVTRRPMPSAVARAYCAPYDAWSHRIAVHRFVQDIPLEPGAPAWNVVTEVDRGLEQLRGIPMLIAWGERDFVFDLDYLNEWTRRFPEAEVHRFPDCGHYVLEDAAEDIVPLVGDFLRRHPLPLSAATSR